MEMQFQDESIDVLSSDSSNSSIMIFIFFFFLWKIQASASPVLESIIDRPRKHRSSEKTIPILGVPCEAVEVFVRFIYSNRCSEEEMEKFGIHLLALSHVYLIPQLKARCTKALIERLTIENVVDTLQLARLCDAPDLYLKCMKLISNRFKVVEESEGWRFLQDNDPYLELEILKFIDESESVCILISFKFI